MPIGKNKLEHGYPYEPMSIWSQQSHECCKKYYMKLDVHVKHWTSMVRQSYQGLITR